MGEQASFGAELRRLRQGAGLSLAGLAERTYYSKGYLSKVENGLMRPNAALASLCEVELGASGCLVPLLPADTSSRRPRSALGAVSSGLPPATPLFTGRIAELRAIRSALETGPGICVLSGLGGVGKTALALRCAHRLEAGFTDGCLFVDLQGLSEPIVSPSAVHGRMLRHLGLPAESIPADPEERAALYRAHLQKRGVLLVLDNAGSAEQVQALLPGGSRCRVLITSRSRLTALDDAEHVWVDVLPSGSATELLATLTRDDVGDVGSQIVELCGRLPLAIRIAAARLRAHPAWDLGELARRLANASALLTELDDGERSLAASFQLSAGQLTPSEARLFGLLALHPGADFDVSAASALGGVSVQDADRLLERLHNAHLITQPAADRYAFHDLLRAFALSMPSHHQNGREALRRLIGHYLALAVTADQLIFPNRYSVVQDHAPRASPVLHDAAAAWQWLASELPALVTLVQTDEPILDVHRWQLAYTLRGYFYLTKELDAWLATHTAGLAAARRLGDPRAEAITRNNLGMGLAAALRLDEATEQHHAAQALFEALGDQHSLSDCLANLAAVLARQGKFSDALVHQQEALRYYTDSGLARKRGITLRSMSTAYLALEQVNDAIQCAEEALALAVSCSLDMDIAQAANALGAAREGNKQHQQAEVAWRQALSHGERCNSLYEQAGAHWGLGRIALAAGRTPEAEKALSTAQSFYARVSSPHASSVAELLAELRRLP